MNILLKAEIAWINNNIDKYDSTLHARSVIENIKKRYFITGVNKLISEFRRDKTTETMYKLFDFIKGG